MPTVEKSKLLKIRKALEEHNKDVIEKFHKKHAEAVKFAKKHTLTLASAAIMTVSALGGAHSYAAEQTKQQQHENAQKEAESLDTFVAQLGPLIAEKDTLNEAEEEVIAQALSQKFNLNLTPKLEGNRLNEIYGYVGAEQHLYRWQGDNLSQHGLQRSGIAPLQGAFKNFDNAEQEKYYIAVQLHELPTWNQDWPTLKPWYRYRKMFIFNPANQKGMVVVIGDAGPSKFIGKTFGGSPEVMEYLEMKDGGQKGQAIILFVDDAEDKIALGPVNDPDKFLAEK